MRGMLKEKEFAAKEKLEIVQSERVASAGWRKGGLGGNSARSTNFGRNQFEFFRKHTARQDGKLY